MCNQHPTFAHRGVLRNGAAAAAPSFLGDGAAERRIWLNGAAAAGDRDGGGEQRFWLNGAAAAAPCDGAAERRICLNGAAAACDGGGEQRICASGHAWWNDAPEFCVFKFVDILDVWSE
jgi:hypothetical protein